MAQTGLPAWSQTSADNGNADADINFAEGQAPSSLNNSNRAMMAALAKHRDDNSGSLTTGGTSTAYTVTTYQTFDSLSAMSGQTLKLKYNATNGASPTLNVDGLGAKSIVTVAGTAVPTGAIRANSVYDHVYDNANSCWILVGAPTGSLMAPSGTVMIFQQSAAPAGWTKNTTTGTQHALRLTTDNVTTGGTADFTAVFASRTITQGNLPNYTLPNTLGVNGTGSPNGGGTYRGSGLTAAQGGSGVSNLLQWDGTQFTQTTNSDTITGSITSGGSGTAMDFAVKYVDVIRATKD